MDGGKLFSTREQIAGHKHLTVTLEISFASPFVSNDDMQPHRQSKQTYVEYAMSGYVICLFISVAFCL